VEEHFAVEAPDPGFEAGWPVHTPDEAAALITMLASDRTGNVTGAHYVIDGGLTKTTEARACLHLNRC
jgi:hypothetical protein